MSVEWKLRILHSNIRTLRALYRRTGSGRVEDMLCLALRTHKELTRAKHQADGVGS
jgi:hypothetical protein